MFVSITCGNSTEQREGYYKLVNGAEYLGWKFKREKVGRERGDSREGTCVQRELYKVEC